MFLFLLIVVVVLIILWYLIKYYTDTESIPLNLIYESKFSDIIESTNKTYEASGVVNWNNVFYVIFDNLYGLAAIKNIQNSKDNVMYSQSGKNSQYEAISIDRDTGILYFMTETIKTSDGLFGRVQEISLEPEFKIVNECVLDYPFSSENKGFEGMCIGKTTDGRKILFGLCEGNFCSGGKKGKEKGNGRIVVYEQQDKCWKQIKVWNIPSHVQFTDYSDICISLDGTKMAITTQEDAKLWIVDVDINNLTFTSKGTFYTFPNNYCNIEGVDFIDENTIVTVTDMAKKSQPSMCGEKDQSIQIWKLAY